MTSDLFPYRFSFLCFHVELLSWFGVTWSWTYYRNHRTASYSWRAWNFCVSVYGTAYTYKGATHCLCSTSNDSEECKATPVFWCSSQKSHWSMCQSLIARFNIYIYFYYLNTYITYTVFYSWGHCLFQIFRNTFVFLHFEHSKNGFIFVYLMHIFPACLCEYGLSYWVTCITLVTLFDFRSANDKRPALL